MANLFDDPYWKSFLRQYEAKNGVKVNLNTGESIPINKGIGTNFTLGQGSPSQYTGPNFRLRQDTPLKPGYSRVQYYPSTTVLNRNTPTVPFDFMKSANKAATSNPSLLSRLRGAGRFVGPALGLGEVFMGRTIPSKVLGGLGAGLSFVKHPVAQALGTAALIGAGAVDTYSNPQSQIDKSNKDFAKYESMFGTPDNPNLSNLAPGLKPLSDAEVEILQFKANRASQPQVTTPQVAQVPTQEEYQAATNEIVNKTMNEQNQLNQIANSLQPQPVQYKANIFGQNVYNATPDLSAATENTIDQMNQAIQGVPNLYQNMFGQGDTEVGGNALANYIQLIQKQQEAKQILKDQMLAGYQQAVKQDRYQDLINGISDAFQNYNYNRSLVFLPSGFNPNGGQTFTPYHLTNAPKETQQEKNVDKYLKELQIRNQLAPDYASMNEAMTQALQAQALGEATGTNPLVYMGNADLSKQMMDKVLGPQISEGAKTRAELAKLSPETYAKMVEELNKAKANSITERMKGEYDLAGKNIEQYANTDRANASEQNKFFMNHMNNYVNLAKQGMSDENALAKLRLTGMNNEQLARLKADLESSDPIKQVNAAAQLMNAYTRFVTPQEAQSYQNQLFPGGLPQFTNRRSP